MGVPEGISWRDVPGEEVLTGIFRQTVTGESFTIVRYTYQPGSVFPLHAHDDEQLTLVHTGEIEFTVGGRVLV